MWIALIIVGGLTLMTIVASGFDYLGKRKLKVSQEMEGRVAALEQKLEQLQAELQIKNNRIEQLDDSVSFLNKLVEDKQKK